MRNITVSNQALFIALRLLTIILLCSVILLAALADWSTVTAQGATYENFYSVTPSTYDSDYDGYDDSVTLQMDVDTTGGYVDVTADLDLEDSQGYLVFSNSLSWNIYGEDTEYGEFYITITSGDPGYFSYYLDLYDDQYNWEDSWSGSVYLYPLGYGTTSDYDEYFESVTHSTYDSDSDGYDDSVTLQMDVDTTGGYVDVTADVDLEDSQGYLVVSDSLIWNIYGEDTEYGEFYINITSGDPGYFSYYLDLYDNLGYWEDSWSGSFYLYPMGYGHAPVTTPTTIPLRTFMPFQTQIPFSTPKPGGGGLSGALIGGIISAIVLLSIGAIVTKMNRKFFKGKQAPDPRISKLRAQMEQWREQGYDVSELEDLFK